MDKVVFKLTGISGLFLMVLLVSTGPSGQVGATDKAELTEPAGTIAFMITRDGNYKIYIMEPDGSNPVSISNHPSSDRLPCVSPDWRRFVFSCGYP